MTLLGKTVKVSFRRSFVITVFLLAVIFLYWHQMTRPRLTSFDIKRTKGAVFHELTARREAGHLDKIPLRELVPLTAFLNTPMAICERSVHEMVILVQSACSHADNRAAIRETWGKKASLYQIPTLFFVGQCPNIKQEIEQYEDVVEVDCVDSYHNLSLKTFARLRWFLEFCPKVKFLFMSDDDTVIHFSYLLDYVRGGLGYAMIGHHYKRLNPVVREKESKWYQPYWVYPYPYYPDYLSGSTYVVNGSVVKDLYDASLETTYLSLEDVLFTGIAATMAGIVKAGDDRFTTRPSRQFECGGKSIFSEPNFTPNEMRSLWFEKLEHCKS